MKNKAAYQQYQEVQVKTANQGKLILMLYQGGIKFLRLAVKCIENKDWEGANNYLQRARKIIKELMSSLDFEKGDDIAEDLFSIYEYMNHELIQANIHKDIKSIKFVEKLMQKLLSSWQQIINGNDEEKINDKKLNANV